MPAKKTPKKVTKKTETTKTCKNSKNVSETHKKPKTKKKYHVAKETFVKWQKLWKIAKNSGTRLFARGSRIFDATVAT